MSETFQVTFDTESKLTLINSIKLELQLAEDAIKGGDYSEDALMRFEKALRIYRGILYTKPLTNNPD